MEIEESKKVIKRQRGITHKKVFFTFFLIVTLTVLIVYYPDIANFLDKILFSNKVNSSQTSIGRLELVRIFISLISPILTFIVFRNTLRIQSESDTKNTILQMKVDRKDSLNNADREFYNLLSLFSKQQKDRDATVKFLNNKAIEFINNNKFIQKNDYDENGNIASIGIIRYLEPGQTSGVFITEKIESEEDLYNKKLAIISDNYEKYYNEMGPYFKVFHRIIKTLNLRFEKGDIGSDDYSSFIGILRTQISEKEFIVLLINAIFIQRGIGLGVELVRTGFFGDDRDFFMNQHFKTPDDSLIKSYLHKTALIEHLPIVNGKKEECSKNLQLVYETELRIFYRSTLKALNFEDYIKTTNFLELEKRENNIK